ncbi:MAG: glutamate formimidoyltransferase [Acidobacteria bacterium]|nr:glutamate formimidoyltransferase [Acidobacteriota bacterium]
MRRLVECVPNFSEGRDARVVDEIVRAIASAGGIMVLDREMDADHHRSVITFAGPVETVVEAAVRGVEKAAALIDLTRHRGEHPRIGATDVVPFVPLEGVSIEECVELARRAGEEIWRRCRIPVYYYESAARDPERVRLENIRRGQFEGLREEVRTNPARRPDVGEAELHPTAGATVVGARKFLIAYNVYLATPDVEVAKRIARKVRASSGGLPFVKAMGLEVKSRAQVSMNLTDFEQTPVHVVFDVVEREARNEGTRIESSEIVGLIPKKALELSAAFFLRVENFEPRLVLENRLADSLRTGLGEFLDQVAAPTPTPGGGSAAAAAAALAAALGAMVAGLAKNKKPGPELERLVAEFQQARRFFELAVERDAASYEAVRAACRLPKGERAGPVEAALQGAAMVPLEVAEAARELEGALERLRELAPAAMSSDLETAVALALAAGRGARANVEINLAGIHDPEFLRRVEERLQTSR